MGRRRIRCLEYYVMFDAKVTLCVSEVVRIVVTILRLTIPDALMVLRRFRLGAVWLA
jgi:hypothetical protein